MADESTSRREFLAASGVALATLWLTADANELRASLSHAAHAARSKTPVPLEAFTPDQAADVEAIASTLIPTDATPGAREAHVLNFIDHSMANWAKPQLPTFLEGLKELNAEGAKRWPGVGSFSKLPSDARVELLTAWEKDRKPFFEAVRSASIQGMFSLPAYGGNYDQIGWKLLGFEDRFVWQPPFGAYDAELPDGGR